MSDLARFEAAIRASLSDIRAIEPSSVEVQTAVRRATSGRRGTTRVRRVAVAIAVTLALLSGTALAIPQTREAIFDVFGEVADFLTGGTDPPGEPASVDLVRLSWFTGRDPTSGTVVARANGTALVAFRHPTLDLACLAYSLGVAECETDEDWARELEKTRLVVRGPATLEPGQTGVRPIFGIVADDIRTVDLVYADGSTERATGVRHGFVIFADPERDPTRLVALDAAGRVVETVDISNLQWRESP